MSTRNKIVSFGELLLRLAPKSDWLHTENINIFIGGSELNVVAALSKWGIATRYITALPDNYISKQIISYLSDKSVDCSKIVFTGDKIGSYFLPFGSELKNEGVIYDRANSSYANIKPGNINWDDVFDECDWFHISAISPAVSESAYEVCKEAIIIATKKGLKISFDLNYRSKLWKYGKDPRALVPELIQHCDILMGNLWSAESLLGVETKYKNSEGYSDEQLDIEVKASMEKIKSLFPNINTLAYTFRHDSRYRAIMLHENQYYNSKNYPIENIINKVGSGDCFMAGLIYGLRNNQDPNFIINLACSAAVGKLSEISDITNQSIESILERI